MCIIETSHMSYSYHSKHQGNLVLQDVSCQFSQGHIYSVLGESGSGKSTFLSLVAGLDLPTEGSVLFKGRKTSEMDLNHYRREEVAVVYQDFKLFPMLTVLENVMYPMELCGIYGKEAKEQAEILIDKVGLPKSLINRYPSMISGGEQQRTAIARALTLGRKVILADEPTGNLDYKNSENILNIFKNLAHEEECCIIIVTHDLYIANETDEIYVIEKGRMEKRQPGTIHLR